MKTPFLFLALAAGALPFFWISVFSYDAFLQDELFLERGSAHLMDIANSKTNEIRTFLNSRKTDAEVYR